MYSRAQWESAELLLLQTHVPAPAKKSEEPPALSKTLTWDVALHCQSSMMQAWVVQASLCPLHEVGLPVTPPSCSLAWMQYPYTCPGASFSSVCGPWFWAVLDYLSTESISVLNKINYIWLFINFSGNICKEVWDLLLIKWPDVTPLAPLFPVEGEIKNLVPRNIHSPSYLIFISTSLELRGFLMTFSGQKYTCFWYIFWYIVYWKLLVVEKQVQYLHCYWPLLSQHQELRIKLVFSSRLKSSSFAKRIIYDDVCVAVPSVAPVITSVMMTKQKRIEGNHPVSKFIKYMLCNNSNPKWE